MSRSKKDYKDPVEQTQASMQTFDQISSQRENHSLPQEKSLMVPVLRVLKGPRLGDYFILRREENTLGRDSSCVVTLKDPKISRVHCQFLICQKSAKRGECRVVVEDLGSRNGLLLNDHHLTEPRSLHNGDVLKIGSNTFGFYLKYPEEVELESYLYKLAKKDSMTGLMSRSFFQSTLDFEFKRAVRYKRPMTFVLMDIDFFKRINDSYGHHVGDMVLERVGALVSEELRGEDIGIRYGGEEFALILPETHEQDAWIVIERIRQRLEKTKFKIKDYHFKVTASFGIAEVNQGASSSHSLVHRADKALYEAKNKGRNQSVFASKLAS